jgi:hypothetical protein
LKPRTTDIEKAQIKNAKTRSEIPSKTMKLHEKSHHLLGAFSFAEAHSQKNPASECG